MDIDLPTEVGPTEETVQALMEYLVGPLLPLKHGDNAKEPPSVSQQKLVAKQVHAAAILYNYYHRNNHRELEFLDFEQFCNLAMMFKPSILQHMKHMCQYERPTIDDPENQLSLTEKAIMEACTISEALLDASPSVSSSLKEWPITKVAVLLVDSNKENCLLKFDNGVWSIIEKDLCSEDTTVWSKGNRGKKRKTALKSEHGVHDEDGFRQLAFSAVEEIAGITAAGLKVLESHVVYSLSKAKTATCFYIVQCTQSVSEDLMVPIQDAIHGLQGPVVKRSSGSWMITSVVEYLYLLPYAGIMSEWFSRGSNSLPDQVGGRNTDTNKSQSSKKSSEKEVGKSNRSSSKALLNDSKSESESSLINNSGNEIAEKHCDAEDTENRYKSDRCCTTSEPASKEVHDVITSELIENACDKEVVETTIATSKGTMAAKQKDIDGSGISVLNSSSKGPNSKGIEKPAVCLQTENEHNSMHTPLKVYHHQKKSTPSNAMLIKEEMTDLKKTSSISICKDEKVDGEEKSCIISPHGDGTPTADRALTPFQQNTGNCEKIQLTVAAKKSELSQAALRALSRKREKLFNQLRNTKDKLALCDRKIQAILDGGTEDSLDLKLEAIIDFCNEMCLQDDMQAQDGMNQHVGQGLPLSLPLSGKKLSEAQLTLRRACQELDDICRVNNWILPTYDVISSAGGFVANVTVKGTDFELSSAGDLQPSPREARNLAAEHMIKTLQQMASKKHTTQSL